MDETITITLPISGKQVVLKSWISGRDNRALTGVMLNQMKDFSVNTNDGEVQMPQVSSALSEQYDDARIKLVVISFDGHKDGEVIDGKPFSILDAVLDADSRDTDAVLKAITDVTSAKKN